MSKIVLVVVGLIAVMYGLVTYIGREQIVDPEVQRQVESTIPECQERDRIANSITEIEPGVYLASDLNRYSKAADACFSEFVKKVGQSSDGDRDRQ